MNQRIRTPAFQAPQPPPASTLTDDPAARLAVMYRRIWETSMRDLPFVNHSLAVEAVGFRRWRGDWVGVLITPWFLNLFVVPGGGELWSDRPSGERCTIAFPVGELEFIADDDASHDIPACQYCALITQVGQFATQAAARAAAEEALFAVFAAPSANGETTPQSRQEQAVGQPEPSRRAFFRRVAGH